MSKSKASKQVSQPQKDRDISNGVWTVKSGSNSSQVVHSEKETGVSRYLQAKQQKIQQSLAAKNAKSTPAPPSASSFDADEATLRVLELFMQGDADEQRETFEALEAGLAETRQEERRKTA